MKDLTVLLGYELTTGREVRIPVRHMAVTGITQESGKTTTLEALIGRSGLRAVTFVTKRAEGAFQNAARIPAYFREHTDWMFVESLLEALLQQKMKFERSWIMRICKGANNLREVQANIAKAMQGARSGLDESVYFTLSEYFEQLVPEIEALPYSKELKLQPGINVIDVSEYSTHLQGLVIRSVMEWIYEKDSGVITLVPESWEFVPQRHGSPVKTAAIQLIRKGAAAGNYVWLDSQDLAGVDKEIVKQVSVYILGVQREFNEVKRTLLHLPAGTKRPKAEQIMQLGRGWFYASFANELRCVYVQPAWLDADPQRARQFAIEDLPASYVAKPETKSTMQQKPRTGAGDSAGRVRSAGPASEPRTILPGENAEQALARVAKGEVAMEGEARNVFERCEFHDSKLSAEANRCVLRKHKAATHVMGICAYERGSEAYAQVKEEYDQIAQVLYEDFNELQGGPKGQNVADTTIRLLGELKQLRGSAVAVVQPDMQAIIAEVITRLKASNEFPSLQVSAEKPELNVAVRRKVIDLDGSTLKGKLAQLIAEGWFDEAKTGHAAYTDLQRRGFPTAKPNVYRELDKLAEWGFLTKEASGGYLVVQGMKINIREEAA